MDLHLKGLIPYGRMACYHHPSSDRGYNREIVFMVRSGIGFGYLHYWICRGASVLWEKIHPGPKILS